VLIFFLRCKCINDDDVLIAFCKRKENPFSSFSFKKLSDDDDDDDDNDDDDDDDDGKDEDVDCVAVEEEDDNEYRLRSNSLCCSYNDDGDEFSNTNFIVVFFFDASSFSMFVKCVKLLRTILLNCSFWFMNAVFESFLVTCRRSSYNRIVLSISGFVDEIIFFFFVFLSTFR